MSNPWQQKSNATKTGGGGNPPPWMKNNNNPGNAAKPPTNPIQPATTSNNQNDGKPLPPWMKNKQQNSAQQPPQPAQKKEQPPQQSKPPVPPQPPGKNAPPTTGATPPWMKNKPAGGNPPPTGNQPWMKNKTNTPQGSQNTSKIEEISQIPKPTQSKQESKQNISILQQAKEIQDKNNSEEAQEQSINQAPKKLQKNVKTNKKAVTPKKSPVKKQKKTTANLNTTFNRYMNCLADCFPDQEEDDYEVKLSNQEKLLEECIKFRKICEDSIREHLKQRKLMQRKNNFLLLNSLEGEKQQFFCKYYLVQSSRYASNENAEKSQKNVFKVTNMITAEILFQLYNILFQCIIKLLKKKNAVKYKLRAPLITLVEYKGVYFLCEAITEELTDAAYTPAHNIHEISAEINMLEKQLKQFFGDSLPINKNMLQAKKIKSSNQSQQQSYIIYINQNSPDFNIDTILQNYESYFLTPQLNLPSNFSHSVTNSLAPTFFSNLEYLSIYVTRISYLDSRKISTIQKAKVSGNESYGDFISCLEIAHAVRVVYASCQGEIDDPVFWKILFEGNLGIWQMVHNYLGKQIALKSEKYTIKNKHLLACLIGLMLPLTINQKQVAKSPSKHNQNIIKQISCFSNIYSLQNLQLLQICQIFSKYQQIEGLHPAEASSNSNKGKAQLAQASLRKQEKILSINKMKPYYGITELTFNRNSIMFMLKKGQYNQAINLIEKDMEKYSASTNKNYLRLIGVYLLAIMCYMFGQGNIVDSDLHNSPQKEQNQADFQQQSQQKRDEQQSPEKKGKKESKEEDLDKSQDMQLKILKVFSKLLEILTLFADSEEQFWFHSHIYMILASYYSNKAMILSQNKVEEKQISQASILSKSNFSDEEDSSQLAANISKQFSTSLKFLDHSFELITKYYGNMSIESANILYQQSLCHYQQQNYVQAKNTLENAIRIYKPSSKNHKALLDCIFLMGKIQMNQKRTDIAKQMLENVGAQYLSLGKAYDAIDLYEFLYTNSPLPISFPKFNITNAHNRSFNPQTYLQKQYEIGLSYKLPIILIRLNKRIISTQVKLYPKQKQKILENLHKKFKQQRDQQNEDDWNLQIMNLQEHIHNYGSCIQTIRWALTTVVYSGIGKSEDNEMAVDVIKIILSMMSERDINEILL